MEVRAKRLIGHVGNAANLDKRESAELRGSRSSCTFPCDRQRACRLVDCRPPFEADHVFIAARDSGKVYVKRRRFDVDQSQFCDRLF